MRDKYSIKAFCDMLAGEDYQEINAKYRLNVSSPFTVAVRSALTGMQALKDTLLLCTTEIGLDSARRKAKL